jgi:surface protein
MNKSLDERLIPNGEYIDALNLRNTSTEKSEVGLMENCKGNKQLTFLKYPNGDPPSNNTVAIGAIEYGSRETIIWFVHDPSCTLSATGKCDMIVSYNARLSLLTYHVVSMDDGGGVDTTLNFNPQYLITGVNVIDDLMPFNDFYNPPRCINLTKSYPLPVSFIDQFTQEDILLIQKPPISAPLIKLQNTSTQETYLDVRFICFAYRYRYEDNRYSAISQFSAPAFVPGVFEFNMDNYLNKGMTNTMNTAVITYNSGGRLVVGIDLLFMEMVSASNIIKVIEKIDKKILGLADDTEYTYTFTNAKIFTVLPDYELLRLYDNVPLLAKAQTILGNRLFLTNYVEGYDLTGADGNDINVNYRAELVSRNAGETDLTTTLGTSAYTIDGSYTIPDSIVRVDLTGISLIRGSAITIEIRVTHNKWTGEDADYPFQTDNTDISFTYILTKDYDSVYHLASSEEFLYAVGTLDNIKSVADSCDGGTFTDIFNCAIPDTLGDIVKWKSGINADDEPIRVISSPDSSEIGFQVPAMHYTDTIEYHTVDYYEYYSINLSRAVFQEIANPTSLHSNRGYEVGIVYMDDFLRSTPALVSRENTINIPCSLSDKQNKIKITLNNLPPTWAVRYKFVIKADRENYETIYSTIFFRDPNSNSTYFLLEGDNSKKVETGDRLIVKRDSQGAVNSLIITTVLEKEAKAEGFLQIPLVPPVEDVYQYVPAGVYMKINANNFAAERPDNAVFNPGLIIAPQDHLIPGTSNGSYPLVMYPTRILDPDTGKYVDFTIPAGSLIKFYFKFERRGVGNCPTRIYTIDENFVVSADYTSFQEWFLDNKDIIQNGTQVVRTGGDIHNLFNETPTTSLLDITGDIGTNNWRFYENTTIEQLYLTATGTAQCSGGLFGIGSGDENRQSTITANISIVRSNSLVAFETEPSDALPDVFFENEESFAITDGFHEGNTQTQTETLPAIIDTNFFNCFCFGNGVESYKIYDQMSGKPLALGNRVTSTSAQDYKRVHRNSDTTWSGIYNNESNVNRFNEFNLGLVNFKQLEKSFGAVQITDGRQTDMLVIQEDKISYVLLGKNLLSDAAAGGTITSIPEVLGTQLARTEKAGISSNPESYAVYGADRYFADSKRGVVWNLKGGAYNQDQLIPISFMGMKGWFRDLFNSSFNKQKIGGYDPYMTEYVISSNENLLPIPESEFSCGLTLVIGLVENTPVSYTVDLGSTLGEVTIAYTIPSYYGLVTIEAVYNGQTYSVEDTNVSGTLTFTKNLISQDKVYITITSDTTIDMEVSVSCPERTPLTIIHVTVTNNEDHGKLIHNEYRFTQDSYVSPLQTDYVTFLSGTSSPLVSRYFSISGYSGEGSFPVEDGTVRMICDKKALDTFDFLEANKFRYLVSDTLYGQGDVASLLSASETATPNVESGDTHYADFAMPTLKDYLYLIWDYRSATEIELCYTEVSKQDACCNCIEPSPFITTWKTDNLSSGSSNDHQVTLPLDNGTYNFIVDWGDGSSTDHIITSNQAETTHTYSEIGTYTITITGIISGWRFYDGGDKLKILDISQWGCLKLIDYTGNVSGWFMGCANMECSAMDIPDISEVTDFSGIFQYCASFNGDLSSWDVSNVVNMHSTFFGCSVFNSDLSGWNVSNVVDMQNMFAYCSAFNSDLSEWDVSNVTSMYDMFLGCSVFNSDLSSWDVSNVTDMRFMFANCSVFNSDLSGWNVGNVTDMRSMFSNCSSFNSDLSSWDVSKVTSMSYMFYHCSAFNSDLSSWDITSVIYINSQYSGMGSIFINSGMSVTNYSNMLIAWSLLGVNSGVYLNASAKYNLSAVSARAILTGSPNNWVISDGGLET